MSNIPEKSETLLLHDPVSLEMTDEDHLKLELAPLLPLKNQATLASPEISDDLDDRETVETPYPGVDDGLFEGNPKTDAEDFHPKTDAEDFHPKTDAEDFNPKTDEEDFHPKPEDDEGEIPELSPRIGGDGVDNPPDQPPDGVDGQRKPLFPDVSDFKPGRGFHEIEIGSGIDESTPDVNVYQHKKTLAQGMMDLALFSANANQLRYVLESNKHPYYYPSLVLISISLAFQIAVGIGLIWNATYNVKVHKDICQANRVNNFTVIGIFLVTVVNVFISAFGVGSPPAAAT